jgi:drug/metabolite transporter (DMT)-like permease
LSALAALAGCWVLNGFWPIVGQEGVRYFHPAVFFQGGLALCAVLLTPWVALRGRWRRALRGDAALPLAAMAALTSAAAVIYLQALRYTTPSNAAVMAQVEVIYSAAISIWLLGERIGPAQIAASFLVVTGAGIIMGQDMESIRWKGDLMILLTPWMFQVSHAMVKRLPKDLDVVLITWTRSLFGALLLVPFTAWALRHGAGWSLSPGALSVLAVQGLFMNAASILLWYRAILRMDLSKATAFLLSYPALTMLFSWALGRERVSLPQVAGLCLTMLGALWLTRIMRGARSDPSAA